MSKSNRYSSTIKVDQKSINERREKERLQRLADRRADAIWEKKGKRIPRVVLLRCRGCGQRYYQTKNLYYLGARSIFRFAGGCQWMANHFDQEPDCSCPFSDLEVDEELMNHIVDCEECKEFGY